MFGPILDQIGALTAPETSSDLLDALQCVDRLRALITDAVGRLDRAQQWALDGATSMTAWLRAEAGLARPEAGSVVRTARTLAALPVTAQAWHDGTMSSAQVQAIVANVPEVLVELFAAHESDIVPTLIGLSPDRVARAMQHWRACAEATSSTPPDDISMGAAHLSQTFDGTWRLDATLTPEGGEVIDKALQLALGDNIDGDPIRTYSQRLGDTLVDVCRWFLDHQHIHPGGRHRPHLNLSHDLDGMTDDQPGRYEDGTIADAATFARIACDAAIHRLLTRGRSTIIDYGTATRTIPAPLWQALVARDRSCRWPGCDRRPAWCEGHHITHWTNGGPTCLTNLVLLCTRHHHLGHQPGWTLTLEPGATLHVQQPNGRLRQSRPPP